jgi:hypothetical protein
MARVRAQLRRRARSADGGEAVLAFGGVRVDMARRSVERDGVPLHLTPLEYRLLTHLCRHPDRVLTHRRLLQAVWDRLTRPTPIACACSWPACGRRSRPMPHRRGTSSPRPGWGYRFAVIVVPGALVRKRSG